MKWDQFGENWNQFKEKMFFLRSESSDAAGKRDALIDARTAGSLQGKDAQTNAVRPEARKERYDFSQHIGC